MTVLPCDVIPAAAPLPAGAAEGAPGDFLAALLAAMGPAVEDGALTPGADQGEPIAEDPDLAGTPVVVLDPALAALVAQQLPVTAGCASVAEAPRMLRNETVALAPVSKPGDVAQTGSPGLETVAAQPPRPTNTPELAVADRAAPTKEPASVSAEVTSSSAPVQTLPATAYQPSTPQTAPTAPTAATAPVAPPVANTGPLDRVSAQVFPEVTGLVSRGNGTHRITMTLNPEQLGEVRVVMTVRDGAVHVRMAAGHEARAALLDGSPELSRLLEAAGVTEARIVVRELPAAAVSPSNPNPNNGSLDQHAGTRADHQAKDGSDQNTPRPARAEGATSTGPAPRSIQPVIDTRTAGVDVTM